MKIEPISYAREENYAIYFRGSAKVTVERNGEKPTGELFAREVGFQPDGKPIDGYTRALIVDGVGDLRRDEVCKSSDFVREPEVM